MSTLQKQSDQGVHCCYSVFWIHYSMETPQCWNVRVITAFFLGGEGGGAEFFRFLQYLYCTNNSSSYLFSTYQVGQSLEEIFRDLLQLVIAKVNEGEKHTVVTIQLWRDFFHSLSWSEIKLNTLKERLKHLLITKEDAWYKQQIFFISRF